MNELEGGEGTDQCTLGCTVHANQKSEIGSNIPPTQVMVRRFSGASRPPAATDIRTYFARFDQRAKRSLEVGTHALVLPHANSDADNHPNSDSAA